jgi:ATP-dependent RNA helicase DeaD
MSDTQNQAHDDPSGIDVALTAAPLSLGDESGASPRGVLSGGAPNHDSSSGAGLASQPGQSLNTATKAISFYDLSIPIDVVDRIPFDAPTDIQVAAIPPALLGRDVLATSFTGSGKTLAYGIPIITHLLSDPHRSALVLAPTRELAIQLEAQLRSLIPPSTIRTALLIGGQSYVPQIRQLNSGARLFVGTPGRVKDYLEKGSLRLNETELFVLDEADRMLDMGFEPLITEIAGVLPERRLTLLFSATMSKAVEKTASRLLNDPVRVNVGERNTDALSVLQKVWPVDNDFAKRDLLDQVLKEQTGTILIFVKTKAGAERLAASLVNLGQRSASFLHSDLDQRERGAVIKKLRDGKISILVATDLAARGLDVPRIECVVNYDLPMHAEDYVHRIGRTGRAGASGTATTFLTRGDHQQWRAICKFMGVESFFSGEIAGQLGNSSSEIHLSQRDRAVPDHIASDHTASDLESRGEGHTLGQAEPDLVEKIPHLPPPNGALPLTDALRPNKGEMPEDEQQPVVSLALITECCNAAIDLIEAFNAMGSKLSGRTLNIFRSVNGIGCPAQSLESEVHHLRITREDAESRLESAQSYLVAAVALCSDTVIPSEAMVEALRVYANARIFDRLLTERWLLARDDATAASNGNYRESTIHEARTRVMAPVIDVLLKACVPAS